MTVVHQIWGGTAGVKAGLNEVILVATSAAVDGYQAASEYWNVPTTGWPTADFALPRRADDPGIQKVDRYPNLTFAVNSQAGQWSPPPGAPVWSVRRVTLNVETELGRLAVLGGGAWLVWFGYDIRQAPVVDANGYFILGLADSLQCRFNPGPATHPGWTLLSPRLN